MYYVFVTKYVLLFCIMKYKMLLCYYNFLI